MEGSIFKKGDKWEDKMSELTPVHQASDGSYFKREDYFAPFGYGNINGSKLRQCIWLVQQHVLSKGNKGRLFSAASVLSPQLPMSTAVAQYFGMEATHVIGASKPETAIKKPMVFAATEFGASFYFAKVGYNPYIQSKVKSLIKEAGKDDYYLNYGITVTDEADHEQIFGFHGLGGLQVENIPEGVENLIIPAGSCNSTVSILLGIYLMPPKSLSNVFLCGIGPDKLKLIQRRLDMCSKELGLKKGETISDFFNCHFDSPWGNPDEKGKIDVFYENIISSGYTTYDKKIKYKIDKIDFHPTYEGKVMKWVNEFMPEFFGEKTLFWIVGSQPKVKLNDDLKIQIYGSELSA